MAPSKPVAAAASSTTSAAGNWGAPHPPPSSSVRVAAAASMLCRAVLSCSTSPPNCGKEGKVYRESRNCQLMQRLAAPAGPLLSSRAACLAGLLLLLLLLLLPQSRNKQPDWLHVHTCSSEAGVPAAWFSRAGSWGWLRKAAVRPASRDSCCSRKVSVSASVPRTCSCCSRPCRETWNAGRRRWT